MKTIYKSLSAQVGEGAFFSKSLCTGGWTEKCWIKECTLTEPFHSLPSFSVHSSVYIITAGNYNTDCICLVGNYFPPFPAFPRRMLRNWFYLPGAGTGAALIVRLRLLFFFVGAATSPAPVFFLKRLPLQNNMRLRLPSLAFSPFSCISPKNVDEWIVC